MKRIKLPQIELLLQMHTHILILLFWFLGDMQYPLNGFKYTSTTHPTTMLSQYPQQGDQPEINFKTNAFNISPKRLHTWQPTQTQDKNS